MLLAISVPTSKFGMSLAQMILAANWLFDKRVLRKFGEFFTNKTALIFLLLFFIHIIWLFNTSNFHYALDDLRTKAPIFILAVIFSTTPRLTEQEFRWVLVAHLLSVLTMSIIAANIYYIDKPADFRLISPHISHIRLALNVCIAIFTLVYLIFKSKISLYWKPICAAIIIWFLFFLTLLQSATGLVIVFVIALALSIYAITTSTLKKQIKIAVLIICFSTPLLAIYYVYHTFQSYNRYPNVDFSALDSTTFHGEKYINDTLSFPAENGKWIGLYLCESEVQWAWNQRSKIKYHSKDSKGTVINYTIVRYLTSKNLRKDYEGVNKLTNEDIKNIENGIASVDYVEEQGIKSRLYKLFWEYKLFKRNGDIKGHSLFQRIELWTISTEIIASNWLFGVGTGDVPDDFKAQLITKNSPLKDTRLRSHNQYLSLFIAFGIVGFILSLFSFIYPFVRSKLLFDYFCMIFLIVFFMSMLTEDTIESQDGVTFYAFFAALYLFQKPLKKRIEN
jgi:hypothetical protein